MPSSKGIDDGRNCSDFFIYSIIHSFISCQWFKFAKNLVGVKIDYKDNFINPEKFTN